MVDPDFRDPKEIPDFPEDNVRTGNRDLKEPKEKLVCPGCPE